MNGNIETHGAASHQPRQYSLFRLFGFEVKIDLSWLLLALLITWTLAAGAFPANYPGLARETYWWMGVWGAVGVFFSIVFHEFAHSLVARRFGVPIKGITLFIFGGVAEMEEEPPNPRSEFWMAIAGPVASFVLAGLFYLFYLVAAGGGYSATAGVGQQLAIINTVLAVFNLVPAFPLDGGRMLRALLWQWKKDLRSATRFAGQIGSLFGLFLMILGGLAFFQGAFIAGMWWFVIGMFLRGAAAASYRQVLLRETLQGEPIRRFMNPEPVTVSPKLSLEQLVNDYVYRHHFKMFPVVDRGKLVGCITTGEVRGVPRDEWRTRTVREVMLPCSPENMVSPDTDTVKVLSMMLQPGGRSRLMVVDDGRLVGIISVTDLREFITLKLELEPPGH